MPYVICVLSGFVGGCLCQALFARRIANALADELHALGNHLHRT